MIAANLILALQSTISSLVSNIPPYLATYMQRADVLSAIDTAMGPGASLIALTPTLNIEPSTAV